MVPQAHAVDAAFATSRSAQLRRRKNSLRHGELAFLGCVVFASGVPVAYGNNRPVVSLSAKRLQESRSKAARKHTNECVDVLRNCAKLGSQLFVFGKAGQCKYPAAELCPRTCHTCEEVLSASRCQHLESGVVPAFRGRSVDWAGFFGMMLARSEPEFQGNLLSQKPWIAEFPNFLNAEEADALVQIAERTGFEPEESLPKRIRDVWKIDCEDPKCRLDPFVQEVYRRVSDLLDMPMANYESLEFLKYGQQQHYLTHNDPEPFPSGETVRNGLRVLTVFFYLSDVGEGGETHFPKAQPQAINVKAAKGKVVVWANVQDNWWKISKYAQHQGMPVKQGVKYACNFWVHPFNYRWTEQYAGEWCRSDDNEGDE